MHREICMRTNGWMWNAREWEKKRKEAKRRRSSGRESKRASNGGHKNWTHDLLVCWSWLNTSLCNAYALHVNTRKCWSDPASAAYEPSAVLKENSRCECPVNCIECNESIEMWLIRSRIIPNNCRKCMRYLFTSVFSAQMECWPLREVIRFLWIRLTRMEPITYTNQTYHQTKYSRTDRMKKKTFRVLCFRSFACSFGHLLLLLSTCEKTTISFFSLFSVDDCFRQVFGCCRTPNSRTNKWKETVSHSDIPNAVTVADELLRTPP